MAFERMVGNNARSVDFLHERSVMNLGAVSTIKYLTGVGLLLIVLFTALQPVGSSGLSLIGAFLFWTLQISIFLPLLSWTQIFLQRITFLDRLNPWVKTAIAGVIGAFLFIPLALLIDYFMELDDWSGVNRFSDILPIFLDEIGGVVLPAAITWVGINAPRILKLNFNEPSPQRPPSDVIVASETPKTGIFQLLSKKLGEDIIYIASELHYVRVVTTAGEELLLYNLKDAIDDVSSFIDGIQTHRSYWVARKHISEISNHGSAKQLTLTHEYKVPLSRRKVREVKSALGSKAVGSPKISATFD